LGVTVYMYIPQCGCQNVNGKTISLIYIYMYVQSENKTFKEEQPRLIPKKKHKP